MMIFWDIDGVIRNLAQIVFGRPALKWDEKRDCDGNTLIEAVNKNPDLCLLAGPCEYIKLINEYFICKTVHFLSSQPVVWRENTEKWLSIYCATKYDIIYTNGSDEKLSYLKPGDWLIDDSPCFSDYSQIILIDYPYNQQVNAPYRVHNRKELMEKLEEINWR
jgi:hypothetical protein